jgi:thiamine-phosphate pyrophosphorylase
MTSALPENGLYAITDSQLIPAAALLDHVAQAIAGGARLIQYRDKQQSLLERKQAAAQLQRLCAHQGVPLIINDDIELARTVGAAGVHLGRDDAAIGEARARLGPAAIIGASCYNRLENAVAAARAGASYIAFGRFFSSQSKPDAVQADIALLAQARAQPGLPIAAIGGITPENGRQLVAAGADLLAVIHGVFGQADIEAAARRYAGCFRIPVKPSG